MYGHFSVHDDTLSHSIFCFSYQHFLQGGRRAYNYGLAVLVFNDHGSNSTTYTFLAAPKCFYDKTNDFLKRLLIKQNKPGEVQVPPKCTTILRTCASGPLLQSDVYSDYSAGSRGPGGALSTLGDMTVFLTCSIGCAAKGSPGNSSTMLASRCSGENYLYS